VTDTITILRARRGRRLAKLIRVGRTVEDYDSAFRFDLIERAVADLDGLHRLLLRLLHRPDCCVVRGAPADPARVVNVRRLAYPCKNTRDQPTLRPAPHYWLALDVDGLERPKDIPAADLTACATVAVQRLPGAFHGARCIAQASASHGIKPGIRLRLWYWLDRLTSGGELTRWLRGTPADPSVFRAVQLIYTAAPRFAPGVSDHLPQRIIDMPGTAMVPVPSVAALAPPPPRPPMPLPRPGDAGAGRYAFAALTNAAARVQRAGIGQRHATILREARGLARFINAGLLAQSAVTDMLRGAGANAGKPEDEINSLIEWAMDHPSSAALPEGAAR